MVIIYLLNMSENHLKYLVSVNKNIGKFFIQVKAVAIGYLNQNIALPDGHLYGFDHPSTMGGSVMRTDALVVYNVMGGIYCYTSCM